MERSIRSRTIWALRNSAIASTFTRHLSVWPVASSSRPASTSALPMPSTSLRPRTAYHPLQVLLQFWMHTLQAVRWDEFVRGRGACGEKRARFYGQLASEHVKHVKRYALIPDLDVGDGASAHTDATRKLS